MSNRTNCLLIAIACLLAASPALAHDRNEPRHAVTLWWLIFNSPENCIGNPAGAERCGLADVMGQAYLDSAARGHPDPSLIAPNLASGVAVVHATGGISRKNGRLRLAATIYRSPAEGLALAGPNVVDPLGLGRAYSNPGAEVHLVIRDHGPLVKHDRITQAAGFIEPNCSDPLVGYEAGDNLCVDIQFAVFAPGESGKDSVFANADGRLLPSASAYLFRQGDVMQAFIETNVRHR